MRIGILALLALFLVGCGGGATVRNNDGPTNGPTRAEEDCRVVYYFQGMDKIAKREVRSATVWYSNTYLDSRRDRTDGKLEEEIYYATRSIFHDVYPDEEVMTIAQNLIDKGLFGLRSRSRIQTADFPEGESIQLIILQIGDYVHRVDVRDLPEDNNSTERIIFFDCVKDLLHIANINPQVQVDIRKGAHPAFGGGKSLFDNR
jgi:hypothetical protein